MNFNDQIRSTRTPAQEHAEARLRRDQEIAERERPALPPKWAKKGQPTISLDAAYVGTADPDAEPIRDTVTRREIQPGERRSNAELTDEQREGLRVASVLAAREDLRRVAQQASAPAQPRRLGGEL